MQGEFDVDGVGIGVLQGLEQTLHESDERGLAQERGECDAPDRIAARALACALRRLAVELGAPAQRQLRVARQASHGERAQAVVRDVEHVDIVLGEAHGVVAIAEGAFVGLIQGHHAGVIAFDAVDRARAEAHHQADHAGGRVHRFFPDEGVARHAHTGGVREVPAPVIAAADALQEKRHGLFEVGQPALTSVGEGVLAHGAGEDPADCLFELSEPLLGRALVDEEEAFVFAGKGVAEAVFEQAARAHQDRVLPEIVEHPFELRADFFRKLAAQHVLAQ